MDSGVATRPIADMAAYRQQLSEFVYQTSLMMRPIFAAAKKKPARIVFCEGEDDRVLRAVQTVIDEGMARPIVIGRPQVLDAQIAKCGLRIRAGVDFEVVNPDSNPLHEKLWQDYYELTCRKGIGVEYAKRETRRRTTLIGAMLVRHGHADGMICGTFGRYGLHLRYIDEVIGRKPGMDSFYTMNMLVLPNRTLFIGDTYVNYEPTPEQVAELTVLAAEVVRHFGLTPKVALLSHSSFGTDNTPTAEKMRRALELISQRAPQLEVEGEMHGDAALSEEIRHQVFPPSRLKGSANLLVMPTLDAANIAFNLLKAVAGDGLTVGPMLLGAAKPVHILTPTATVRRIVNVAALLSVEVAQQQGQ
jgi:malate dehydrogenase (oxaloacetate-decarboxylating)(NADP+)